jgi:hypothetical protein
MVGREMAQMRIDDLVRAGARERMARKVRRDQGRSVVRRVTTALASVVLWPIRH